jgi:hypothetical protein
MEQLPEHLDRTITLKQALMVAGTLIVASASSLIWVGSIEARVDSMEADGVKIFQKLDRISDDTSYLRGVIQSGRERKR